MDEKSITWLFVLSSGMYKYYSRLWNVKEVWGNIWYVYGSFGAFVVVDFAGISGSLWNLYRLLWKFY